MRYPVGSEWGCRGRRFKGLAHQVLVTIAGSVTASGFLDRWLCAPDLVLGRRNRSPVRGRPPLPLTREDLAYPAGSSFFGVPGMTDDLKVKVLPGPGRRDRREAQGRDREVSSEGSVERTREPTNRNRMRGAAEQGELAENSEALAAKATWRKSGGCAGKAGTLTQGDLASRLKGRRQHGGARSQQRA